MGGRKAVHGQPWPRSVDSGCMGRVIEPRNFQIVEADALPKAEGNIAAPGARLGPKGPAQRLHRGRRAGHVDKGCPGTWEVPTPPRVDAKSERGRNGAKATKRRPMGAGKSECRSRSEEVGEPTRGTLRSKGQHRVMEPLEGKMAEPQTSVDVSTKLERVAKLAREAPDMAFRNLAHLIDIDWLREAYRRTRKGGARGVDGQSAQEYQANLEDNLQSLLERAKSGTYRAPPVRRVHIPKGSGSETRPLGIPTFEDKVLQRAVAMVLEAVYEQDFLDCSYGFRPRRSAHLALEALQNQSVVMAGGWVLEIDIRKFFGAPGQAWRFQRVKFPPRQGVSRPTGNRVLRAWR